jgi:tetratricopeptide (TPR) repeat protein
MKRILFILAVVFFCAGTLLASDLASDFSAANRFYSAGKFVEAAKAYNSILSSGAVSPNLLFNDGNAEFKSGNLGRAIAAYRQAALLAPRDADVRANLEFARNQVQGATLHESHWENLLSAFTLNEWTALAAIAFWLAFLLFATMQIRPALKNALRGFARSMAVAAIIFCACLAAAATIHSSKSVAVVVLPDAVTRSGPFSDAQNAFAVHDGAELAVLDKRNGWVQVADGNGRSGWMQDGQVKVLPAI